MAEKKRQLPEKCSIDFVICDNTINRYGWRLLVAGIRLGNFMKNPVALAQHQTWTVPVGKWENVRVEGEQLLGTLDFDKNDEFAVTLYWKYKDGYMNAVSLNVIPIAESEDAKMLLPGQKYPTLVESELLEVSCVTIPGQANAVKLSNPDGSEYKLSLLENSNQKKQKMAGEKTVEELQAELATSKALNCENLVAIHKQRGVVTDGEIESLKKLAMLDYDETKKMLEARTAPKTEPTKTEPTADAISAVLELHINRGAITALDKAVFETALKQDFEGTKKVLEAKPGKQELSSFMQSLGGNGNGGNGGADERANWTYLDYFKKDPKALELMQEKEPEKFKRLELAFQEANKGIQ